MDTIAVSHVERRRKPLSGVRVNAGRGTGTKCSMCNQLITPGDVQYDVEPEQSPERGPQNFHIDCFREWYTRQIQP